jgi:Uncharacterized protein involved in tolerance to divalent cations
MFSPTPELLVAWTTVGSREAAEALARDTIVQNLAACVQIDGPVISHYRWQNQLERSEEFRLCLKFLPTQRVPLENFIRDHHPYDTPEWIVVPAVSVGEKYLSWAKANSSTPPL